MPYRYNAASNESIQDLSASCEQVLQEAGEARSIAERSSENVSGTLSTIDNIQAQLGMINKQDNLYL